MPSRLPPTTLPYALVALMLGRLAPPHLGVSAFEVVGIGLIATELHILVHELGHAAVGAALGFRIYAIDTGLFHLRFRPRYLLTWQQRIPLWLAGFTRTTPPLGVTRRRQASLVLGGPILSLVTGMMALRLAHLERSPLPMSSERWALVAYSIAALAGAGFTLVPRWTTRIRFPSDGALLLGILRGQSRPPAPWVSRLRIQSSLGLRPRETDVTVDEALAATLVTETTDGGEQLVLASAVALDGPEPTRARPLVERALAEVGGPSRANARDILNLATLYFSMVEPDAPRAASLLAKLEATEGDPGYVLLARSAAAALTQPDEARSLLAQWVHWTEEGTIPGFRRAGYEWAVERLRSHG